ncbi:MAG: hypothetical protein CMP11_01275 [Zetaproteobacteria bacterium]|nr:hypothetical protein [Pseudobdellovibrionaceae bacterium]|tara:strand:- start:454 stop:834 length:381 start_codon:yes stop_codon:yes gene_type:complete
MQEIFYTALNIFLDVLHLFVITFNLVALTKKNMRQYHFILINITAFSWLILGYFYGWGYCFLTDIHWYIKGVLGEINLPSSYITYLMSWFSISINQDFVDLVTALIFSLLFFTSWIFFLKNKKSNF